MPTRKTPAKDKGTTVAAGGFEPVMRSRDQRVADGKTLRASVPRQSHAGWKRPARRRDPLDILKQSNRDRLPELVPVRYGRMLPSPFTFLRGSSGLMAYDLATTPTTGIRVQACGDCHLLNFGWWYVICPLHRASILPALECWRSCMRNSRRQGFA